MVRLIPSSVFVKDPKDVWGKETTIGLAEHAVRVYAPPSPFEKRGNVIYWDDFESSSKRYYPKTKSGSDGYVVRATNNPKFGDYCLQLTTGSTSGDWCSVYYLINDFHISKIGAQIGIATQATQATLYFRLYYNDGTKRWNSVLRYDFSTDELDIYNSSGSYETIATIPYYKGAAGELIPYSTIKLVTDVENKKYVRALMFGNEIDLSSYSLDSDPMVVDPGLEVSIAFYTDQNVSYTAYFDNLIITENEP